MEETIATVLPKKNVTPPSCYTLEMYDGMPIFIHMDIMEDVVKLVTQKYLVVWAPVV